MKEIQLSHGFVLVPIDAVTLNGIPLSQLNTFDDSYEGDWALIAPNGRAVDSENYRPYRYSDVEEAEKDISIFLEFGECSTCGPAWKADKPEKLDNTEVLVPAAVLQSLLDRATELLDNMWDREEAGPDGEPDDPESAVEDEDGEWYFHDYYALKVSVEAARKFLPESPK